MHVTRPRQLLIVAILLAPSLASAQVVPATRGSSPSQATASQTAPGPVVRLGFDGSLDSSSGASVTETDGRPFSYVEGIEGRALSVGPGDPARFLTLSAGVPPLGSGRDFSVRFWVRTEAGSDRRTVLLSTKDIDDNSLASQKNAGWVFYMSDGTWAWSIGSGARRLTYERDNGQRMPLNDGRWHQLAITYSAERTEIRLFYDGVNWVSYDVADSDGFDFTSSSRATVGWDARNAVSVPDLLPAIASGAERLQDFVDAFNALGQRPIESDELLRLIVDPLAMFEERAGREADDVRWAPVAAAEAALMENPYTIHQALEFVEAAPLTKIYALVDGRIVIRRDVAARYAQRERLSPPDFAMDDLAIWDRVLSPEEVRSSYAQHFEPADAALAEDVPTLTAAVWNIWHGGKHFTPEEHGWDSRVRVAEALEDVGADVIMMQETYSSGDFIAAELGYYFATTVDWDYLNQGANISVLSRYPIREIHVPEDAPFNNVGTKVSISATQDVYVMRTGME